MRRGFVNQKLGKHNSRRAALQRAKAAMQKATGASGRTASLQKSDIFERRDDQSA
jgi:hypothetical protein